MDAAFLFVGLTFLIGGVLWLWGAEYLAHNTAAVEAMVGMTRAARKESDMRRPVRRGFLQTRRRHL